MGWRDARGADHLAKARTSDRPRTPESIRRTRALYLVRRGRQPHSYLAEWKTPAECLTVKAGGFSQTNRTNGLSLLPLKAFDVSRYRIDSFLYLGIALRSKLLPRFLKSRS